MKTAGYVIAWMISVVTVGMVGAVIVYRMGEKALPGSPVAKILGKGV